MVDTSGMTDEEQQQIHVAASADYAKIFENSAMDKIKAETKDMGKDEYKEYATAQAKALYGREDISVDNDGNVTIGTGDEAKTVSRAEFEK